MTVDIDNAIAGWDGKSAADIEKIYRRYRHEPSFSRDIVSLAGREARQRGASWLLKRYLEDGGQLDKKSANTLYTLLESVGDWQTKLHVLQSIPYLPIDKRRAPRLHRCLQLCLADDNKFVRAWAYNGFYELAVKHREYAAQTRQFFDMAMKDEAASVKARIRNLLKKGF